LREEAYRLNDSSSESRSGPEISSPEDQEEIKLDSMDGSIQDRMSSNSSDENPYMIDQMRRF